MRKWHDVAELVVPGYVRGPRQHTTRYRSSRESAARVLRREDRCLTRGTNSPG